MVKKSNQMRRGLLAKMMSSNHKMGISPLTERSKRMRICQKRRMAKTSRPNNLNKLLPKGGKRALPK
jgi:hypothetical protein